MKSILHYSDEQIQKQRAEERDLKRRQTVERKRRGRFFEFFGPHLSGEEQSALERLQRAYEIAGSSLISANRYDGSPPPESFGPRDPSQRMIDALKFIQACNRKIAGDVQGQHPSAAWLLDHALREDLSPQQAGDFYQRSVGRIPNEKKRREKAVVIIQSCARCVVKVLSEQRRG